jgi:oligopeptide/dipeptide ABC transporter, ATP-binding protein, C-terminal domain
MYAGHIVETAPVDQLFHAPHHPYTRSLLAALPNPADDTRPALVQISGRPPLPTDVVEGCPFRPHCDQAREAGRVRPILEQRAAGRVACCVPAEEWRPGRGPEMRPDRWG